MKRGGPNRNQGRKPISDTDRTVTVSLRLTTSQRAKLATLGGASWVRATINAESLDTLPTNCVARHARNIEVELHYTSAVEFRCPVIHFQLIRRVTYNSVHSLQCRQNLKAVAEV
jgi:hypothetical protein